MIDARGIRAGRVTDRLSRVGDDAGAAERRLGPAESPRPKADRELRLVDVDIRVEEQVGGRFRLRVRLGETGGGREQAKRDEAFFHVGSVQDSGKIGKVQEKSCAGGDEAGLRPKPRRETLSPPY